MLTNRFRRIVLVVVVLAMGSLAGPAAPAGAQDPVPDPVDPAVLEGTPLAPEGPPVGVPKAATSRIAETDPELLARDDGARIPVLIKLDYDAIATYDGRLRGLPATSPSVTGDPLTTTEATSGPYARRVARDEAAIVADIRAAVPSATIGQSLRIVFGGVAAQIPADAVEAVLAVDGVIAVQADELQQPLTDSSTDFIGADEVWPTLGGQATAGQGVLFGSLDSGIWPEHPSFADTGATSAPPPTNDGTPRACTFGDNPLTPATDVFACQDKLVGGQPFLATYNANVGGEVYPDSARDSNGHGTHTASTAAGNRVTATVSSVERGQVSGVAPGAWVAAYKVCGEAGCYPSDSAAAVQRAILDGVDVINFSISGGSNPSTDPVELAFLDAYAAGVFVAASAGNSGPGADTADHNGPWVTTVAASSQRRTWASTLTLNGSGGATATIPGVSLGTGVASPLPIVSAAAPPYNNTDCTTPAPPGLFTGKIVACRRGSGRVLKSFNVKQGGAAGMVLYNETPSNLSAETHWVPTVHVADDATLVSFLSAHPGATATFTAGAATDGTPDTIAPFSSRGPGGLTLKPDLAAPGQEILAGHTPTPESPVGGPPGELFRAIDGTSMAAPHVAGSALLLRDLHPTWTPGQIRSALTTTSTPAVTKEDGTTPATPFDTGAGRVQVDAAAAPGLVLDETATRFAALGRDPLTAMHLNIGSIDAPAMPGKLVTARTVTNPGAEATYTAATTAGPGSTITVAPAIFTLAAGATRDITVTIESTNTAGAQEFGSVTLTAPGRSDTRLPVAFAGQPGDVRITGQGCDPASVPALDSSTCTYAVDNLGVGNTTVDLRAEGDATAAVTGADQGATVTGGVATADDVTLDGRDLGVPSIAPGASPAGYRPLDALGTTPTPIGDEEFLTFNVPSYQYNGRTYSRISVNSNGYLVAGSAEAADNECCDLPPMPDPARPNDVLAPFWTDLDGTGAPGLLVAVLTNGVSDWIVVEWRVNVFGTASQRVFQVWIGVNGTQDISFTYDPANLPAAPGAQALLIGAENSDGTGGGQLPTGTLPTGDLRVTSTDPVPNQTLEWDVEVQGAQAGTATITAEASSPRISGSSVARSSLTVTALPLPTITDDPDDLSVAALATATFTAAATGGTFARWEQQAPGGSTWSTVAEATSTTLSFTAHPAHSGTRYRAVFANGTGHEQATAPATLTVAALASTVEVTVDPAAPHRGEDVTFTAALTPGTVGGTVQFAVDGTDVGAPVAVASASATSAPVSDLPAGPHTVTATYAGDGDHDGSSDSVSFTVLTSDEAFVRRAYPVVLGRAADEPGVAFWVGILGDGAPREGVTALLALSGEGRNRLVGTAYQRALGRSADTAGRSYWSGRLARGLSAEDLLATLLATPEAYQRAGGSAAGFSEKLYEVHLGRVSNGPGLAYWEARITGENTAAGRRRAALTFGRAGEATLVAVTRAKVAACGSGAPAPGVDGPLASRFPASGRHPLGLAGSALALLCPPG